MDSIVWKRVDEPQPYEDGFRLTGRIGVCYQRSQWAEWATVYIERESGADGVCYPVRIPSSKYPSEDPGTPLPELLIGTMCRVMAMGYVTEAGVQYLTHEFLFWLVHLDPDFAQELAVHYPGLVHGWLEIKHAGG